MSTTTTTSTTPAMSLAEKVRGMVYYEAPNSCDPMAMMWNSVPDDVEDARDWAMMFGIACGIARGGQVYKRYKLEDASQPKTPAAVA